jgi:hypothetical protein
MQLDDNNSGPIAIILKISKELHWHKIIIAVGGTDEAQKNSKNILLL